MTRRPINHKAKMKRIRQWIFPSLLLSLTPVLAQYLTNYFSQGRTGYSLEDFVFYVSPRGELLIIAVVHVANSASDIWRRQVSSSQKDVFGAFCLIFIVLATIFFTSLAFMPSNTFTISSQSVNFFMIGLILCTACKLAGRS